MVTYVFDVNCSFINSKAVVKYFKQNLKPYYSRFEYEIIGFLFKRVNFVIDVPNVYVDKVQEVYDNFKEDVGEY